MTAKQVQTGLTLVEVLVTAILLSIVLVPAIRALHAGIIGAVVHNDVASNHYRLRSRLETLHAESHPDIESAAGSPTTPSSYSDPAGPPGRILVFISFYDGDDADADSDPFTGGDPGLVWIRVAIEGTAYELQTLTTDGD